MKPKRSLFALASAVVVAIAGCPATPQPTVRPPIEQVASAPATEQRGYLLLRDGSLHVDDGAPISGLYVRGVLRDGRLAASGNVEGDGPLGDAGQPGWLELADGSFHGDQTARVPFKPYLRGYRTPDGEFRPATRTVVY